MTVNLADVVVIMNNNSRAFLGGPPMKTRYSQLRRKGRKEGRRPGSQMAGTIYRLWRRSRKRKANFSNYRIYNKSRGSVKREILFDHVICGLEWLKVRKNIGTKNESSRILFYCNAFKIVITMFYNTRNFDSRTDTVSETSFLYGFGGTKKSLTLLNVERLLLILVTWAA